MLKFSIFSCSLLATALLQTVHAEVPPPQDVIYPGTIKVQVDASDVMHRIFSVHEILPVKAGKLTLLYPQWLPGHHSPSGSIDKLAGLKIRANGKALDWVRDPLDVYAFHVEVPQGVSQLDIEFQFLSPQDRRQGRVVMTPEMLDLQWNAVTLYPAGYNTSRIQAEASVIYPAGWQAGTALEVASRDGNTVHYQPIAYDDLVDSPVYAGKYFKRVQLDEGAAPVWLDIVADDPKYLEISPEQLKMHRHLVQQMYKLYGAHHYDHYDFLLSLSDRMSGFGLEHHRASENGVNSDYFTAWDKSVGAHTLLPHEFNHSWNGKYRRGKDLSTPNFNVPMSDTLLWVYEGQTQFWGEVIAARAGLLTQEQVRDRLASNAARYSNARGGLNLWRTIQDTTNDPVMTIDRSSVPYLSYQMNLDYYNGGAMIWLEVDGKLRELSKGKKSLDDFARAFFGMGNGEWHVNPYTFEDVVHALDTLTYYDWASFLRERLNGHGPLSAGVDNHGWTLVYNDQASAQTKADESRDGTVDLAYSLGLLIGKDGQLNDVAWDSPAFRAGLAPGMKLIAVNGQDYSTERIKDAVSNAAKDKSAVITLLVKNFDEYQMVSIDYHEGLKYPHIERDKSKSDTLSELYKAR